MPWLLRPGQHNLLRNKGARTRPPDTRAENQWGSSATLAAGTAEGAKIRDPSHCVNGLDTSGLACPCSIEDAVNETDGTSKEGVNDDERCSQEKLQPV